MYRKDVLERTKYLMKDPTDKPNFAEMGRQMGCDYRTAKAAYEKSLRGESGKTSRPKKGSKLDPYKAMVIKKLDTPCKISGIYYFIRKQGYSGGLTILKEFCRNYRVQQMRVAKMRFETMPGVQAQADWKENMMLTNRKGEHIVFNIFLLVLGFSRMKFIELMPDKSQQSVEKALIDGFCYFGGAPNEILFDNMKTVADHSRGEFGQGKVNDAFATFAKDAMFKPLLCRAYRPQTKGKAEDLAKLMERLRAFDGEFDTIDDLRKIVDEFRDDLNKEVSQATGKRPRDLLETEKGYLHRPDADLLRDTYLRDTVLRKVGSDSLVSFGGCKYSVNPSYIGMTVTVELKNNKVYIYSNKEIISVHIYSEKKFDMTKEDYAAIMKAGAFRDYPDERIEAIAESNLAIYDAIG